MDYRKRVKGIINISDSSPFPIKLEMIFINDTYGKNFREIISYWLNEKNLEIKFKGEESDLTSSVDIFFKSQGLLVIFINNIFKDFAFYDERERQIIDKENLVEKL